MKNLFVIVFVIMFASVACKQGGGSQQAVVEQPEVEVQQQSAQQRGGGDAQRGGRNTGTAEERAKAATDRLAELLTLTADQRTRIEAIELELQKQLDAVRQNNQGDMEAMRTAMREIETVREERYKAVLSAAQLTLYTENREQRQRERGAGGGGGQRRNN